MTTMLRSERVKRGFVGVTLTLLFASALSCAGTPERLERAVVFRHGRVPGSDRLLRDLLDRFEGETGIRVIDETLPAVSDVQHQYYITTLEGGAHDLDVLSMDVIWVPEFSRAGWLRDLSEKLPASGRAQFFSAPLEASTYEGRLYAVPWFIDAGVLYYRKDLLEKYGLAVPRTYPELAGAARRVVEGERDPELYGFLWQGKQYEGLVCVASEVLSSFGGYVIRDGLIGITLPESRAAFSFLRELITSGVSPALVTTADEEMTRLLFGKGKAVFLRNWVYAWNLFEQERSPIKGKVGLAPIPAGPGGAGVSTLGGWQLGIARGSRHPEEAWALIEFLTRPQSEASLTRTVGYRPSRPALYLDPSLARDIPILPALLPIVETARPRPVTPVYPAISQALQSEISAVVAGVKRVDRALEDARREIEFVLRELTDDR